ncbi:MAG: hypothetical protein NZU63_13625 [Gemmataceae bacterium]|nr:hypothetical protein [Gemmataceae bacterium]MDW8244284.1 hypothetical protein [Thermogemmata sp.]
MHQASLLLLLLAQKGKWQLQGLAGRRHLGWIGRLYLCLRLSSPSFHAFSGYGPRFAFTPAGPEATITFPPSRDDGLTIPRCTNTDRGQDASIPTFGSSGFDSGLC